MSYGDYGIDWEGLQRINHPAVSIDPPSILFTRSDEVLQFLHVHVDPLAHSIKNLE